MCGGKSSTGIGFTPRTLVLSPEGHKNIGSTRCGTPEVPSYPVTWGISGSPLSEESYIQTGPTGWWWGEGLKSRRKTSNVSKPEKHEAKSRYWDVTAHTTPRHWFHPICIILPCFIFITASTTDGIQSLQNTAPLNNI
jgi:hypothetical protein